MYRNIEGYPDPTAGQAMANIMKERKRITRSIRHKAERKHKKRKMPTVIGNAGKEQAHGNQNG